MAGARPRGHCALLRAAPARGRDDQVEPAEDHRPGHRLALPQRAQEGAEGMRRREFLRTTAVGAAIGCSITRPRSTAAEPPPETTTVRIIDFGVGCMAPQMVADDLLKADGFTAVEYVKVKGPHGVVLKALSDG